MKAPIAMALAMSFASTGALAPAQAIQAFETGNDLYRKCPSTHCRSYVAGVVDALLSGWPNNICNHTVTVS